MRWAVLLLVLAGCQASLGNPTTATDAGGATDATINDALVGVDAPPPISDGPLPDARLCNEGDANAEDPATGHCYMLFQTVRNWADARMSCAALAGNTYLAVITTAEENALVAPLLGLLDGWMGANDIDVEMTWVWLTGEPFVYDNWRVGEPNNSNGENCMIIEGELAGSWDDRTCEQTYAYLCERD